MQAIMYLSICTASINKMSSVGKLRTLAPVIVISARRESPSSLRYPNTAFYLSLHFRFIILSDIRHPAKHITHKSLLDYLVVIIIFTSLE
jgi:hypothetical protein